MMKKQNAGITILGKIVKLLIAVLIIMFLYVAALKSYDFGYRIFAERPVSMAPGTDVVVTLNTSMTEGAVAEMLEQKGIIRDALIFKIQQRFSHYRGTFQAGTYTLNTSMENEEIMAVLSGEINQE